MTSKRKHTTTNRIKSREARQVYYFVKGRALQFYSQLPNYRHPSTLITPHSLSAQAPDVAQHRSTYDAGAVHGAIKDSSDEVPGNLPELHIQFTHGPERISAWVKMK
jgi:hypothetical protein